MRNIILFSLLFTFTIWGCRQEPHDPDIEDEIYNEALEEVNIDTLTFDTLRAE